MPTATWRPHSDSTSDHGKAFIQHLADTYSRDLIDLAMMKLDSVALEDGAHKAADAYGKTVGESLNNAVAYFNERPHRLDECIRALKIDAPRAAVWQSIRDLSRRCAKIEALGR